MQQCDTQGIEFQLQKIEELWTKTRPGQRLMGTNKEGKSIVIPSEDPNTVIGSFDSEAEAVAYSKAPVHIEELTGIIRILLRERQEALQGYEEISAKVDPAHDDFVSQRPVDMKEVLSVTKHWCAYILNGSSAKKH